MENENINLNALWSFDNYLVSLLVIHNKYRILLEFGLYFFFIFSSLWLGEQSFTHLAYAACLLFFLLVFSDLPFMHRFTCVKSCPLWMRCTSLLLSIVKLQAQYVPKLNL